MFSWIRKDKVLFKSLWEQKVQCSGAIVLERAPSEGWGDVETIEREDGVTFKRGDKVYFESYIGYLEGPWVIRFFNIGNEDKVYHCSAGFEHTTCYILSIGLLSHVE